MHIQAYRGSVLSFLVDQNTLARGNTTEDVAEYPPLLDDAKLWEAIETWASRYHTVGSVDAAIKLHHEP